MSVKERVVYSSEKGRICAKCGWPATDCHCASALPGPQDAVPPKITATLNLENAGPGKKVTVIHGLPKNTAFLESLAKELKKSCGTGGKAGEDFVELQGDQRDRLRDLLTRKNWTVKG
jgi:translation initiation factor 1